MNNTNILNLNIINPSPNEIPEIFNNDLLFPPLISYINDENNIQTFNDLNEYNLLDNSFSEELLKEEKMKNLWVYNGEGNYSLININEEFSNENQNDIFLGKKDKLIKEEMIIYKKNRNYLNNNIFQILNFQKETNNINITSETSSSNHNFKEGISYSSKRCDSLLIKFKSFLGKAFIKYINNRLKKMSKRKLKFFSFNYRKFTLNVSYQKNKEWLNEKMKNLLVFGDEPNQEKNEKALRSLYKKKEEEYNEIKDILELSYKDIIKRFYLSKYFNEFKKDEKIIEKDENFRQIMNISLLEPDGFIHFINSRKGNKERIY